MVHNSLASANSRLAVFSSPESEKFGANCLKISPGRLRGWKVPALVCWSDGDPVFPPAAGRAMVRLLPGAKGEVHEIAGASHMLQEDRGEEIARRILEWSSV